MTTTQNYNIRKFMLNAFSGLGSSDAEILAIFHDKLYELGQIIKQRDEELFNEIIRHYSSEEMDRRLKVELNKARRNKN